MAGTSRLSLPVKIRRQTHPRYVFMEQTGAFHMVSCERAGVYAQWHFAGRGILAPAEKNHI